MTAIEVIKAIRALPPQEQEKVICFLSKMKAQQPPQLIDDQAFEAAADQVFDRHAELFKKLAS